MRIYISGSWLQIYFGLLILLIFSGCDGKSSDPSSQPSFDLTGIPLSDELGPIIHAARERMASPQIDNQIRRDLDLYNDLETNATRPESRKKAGDELYRLWRAYPRNLLWSYLAIKMDQYLDRTEELQEMVEHPQLGDSLDPVKLFVTGYDRFNYGGRGEEFLAAWERKDTLDSLQLLTLATMVSMAKRQTGSHLEAAEMLLPLTSVAFEVGGTELEQRFWYSISKALHLADRLDDALHAAVLGLDMCRSVQYLNQVSRFTQLLADILVSRHEIEAALELLEESYQYAMLEDLPAEFTLVNEIIATIYSERGQPDMALKYDREMLTHLLVTSDFYNIPHSMINIADDFRLMGMMDSSFVYVKKARDWVDTHKNIKNLARLPFQEAEYYAQIGDYETADSLLAIAFDRAPSAPVEIDEARLLYGQIQQGLRMGQPRIAYQAIRRLREIDPVLHGGGYDLREEIQLTIAEFLTGQGEFASALETLAGVKETIESASNVEDKFNFYKNQGRIAYLRADDFSAVDAFEKCVAIAEETGNPDMIITARFHMAEVLLRQNQFGAVHDLVRQSDQDTEYGGNFRTRLSTAILSGITYSRENRHEEALTAFEEARRLTNKRSPNDVMALLDTEYGISLMKTGQFRAAQSALLKAVSRLSSRSIGSDIPELRVFTRNPLRDATEILINLYYENPELVANGDLAMETLSRYASYLANSRLHTGEMITTKNQLKQLLGQNSDPLLAFFIGHRNLFLWFAEGDQVEIHKLPNAADIGKLLIRVVSDMKNCGRPVSRNELVELSEMLLAPLENRWPEGATLRVIQNGILARIPWCALYTIESCYSDNPRQLLSHGPIAEFPTFESLLKRSNRRELLDPGTQQLLAIGNNGNKQNATSGSIPPLLRHAEEEAREIADLWPRKPVTTLLGADASWEKISQEKLDQFVVIHIASHIIVHHGSNSTSTIRFAADAQGNPMTTQDVLQLRLQTDLVYLSCCEGASATGTSGIVNFANAFLVNGVRSVIASTEPVDDEASRYLAKQFYSYWLAGKSKAEALRSAQRDLRAADTKWRHPYYWAFYRAIGDGQ